MSKSNGAMVDPKTREFLKSWGPHETPTAQVTDGELHPGIYRAMATTAIVEKRRLWPVVGLQVLLLRRLEFKFVGSMTIGLPVTPKTELYVNALLQTFGWDGRVWPDEEGWPTGTPDEQQIQQLLDRAGLISTLTFPSTENGAPLIEMPVAKTSAPFHLAPFEEVNSPPVHLARFRALVHNPPAFRKGSE
jgi:hypothetical protein